jgi:hypothetical protein
MLSWLYGGRMKFSLRIIKAMKIQSGLCNPGKSIGFRKISSSLLLIIFLLP